MSGTDKQTIVSLLGQVLDENLISANGAILLPRGTKVTQSIVEKLINHRLFAEPTVLRNDLVDAIDNAVNQLDEIFEHVRSRNTIAFEHVYNDIVPTIMEISEYPYVNELLSSLNSRDNYTILHCFAVSMLSTMFGRWLHFDAKQLRNLAIASALHDIGKARIPNEILNKPGRLSNEEYAFVKKHTIFGFELIRTTPGTTNEQALAALQHHERADGSGYPHGVRGREISHFAKIIAIADVFHAMGSKRVYHGPKPTYQILDEMTAGAFGEFDPTMMRLFLWRHMEQLIGTRVLLSNGQEGIIRLVYRREPRRPLIETGEGFIDLTLHGEIRIERLLT